jgi:hypothetical protein
MNQSKQSIAQLSVRITRSTLIFCLPFTFVLLGALSAALVVSQTRKEHSNLISAVAGNIQIALQLGDQFQLKKLAHSLLESGSLTSLSFSVGDSNVLSLEMSQNGIQKVLKPTSKSGLSFDSAELFTR